MSCLEINSVQESLKGLVVSRKGLEVYLDFNIVTRADRPKGTVKVISGGGAGHEPGHAGFVGRGFLTTSISGHIFTSPPVNAIVEGILVTGPKETPILLIVTSYTGDRLNFALAEKIARGRHGYTNIKTILVADDVAMDNVPVGKRGLAGTILVQKIAGAMAELNKPLDEIYSFCCSVNQNLNTIGVSFDADWTSKTIRNIEIGKGIHGEPGAFQMADQNNFESIVQFLMTKFRKFRDSPVLVLLNNLGGTSQHLFQLFSSAMFKEMGAFRVLKIICGTFFTSLDNQGVSVTILDLTEHQDEILRYIEYESEVFWDHFKPSTAPSSTFKTTTTRNANWQNPVKPRGVKVNGLLFRTVIGNICEMIVKNQAALNEMDLEFGDGDTGSTLSRGAQAIEKLSMRESASYFDYPFRIFQEISHILSSEMGGTSGALLGIFFESAAQSFEDTNFESAAWLKLGNEALSEVGRSKRGHRTMLDVLLTAQDVLSSAVTKDFAFLARLKEDCRRSAKATKNMIPLSGRAVYTNSEVAKSAKFPDPGAAFISLVVDSIVDALQSIE